METKKFTSLVFKVISQTADFNYNWLILQQIGVTSHSCSLTLTLFIQFFFFISVVVFHVPHFLPPLFVIFLWSSPAPALIPFTCVSLVPHPRDLSFRVVKCCLFTPSSFVFRSLFERQLCVVAYSPDRLTVAPVCFWSFTLFLCPVLHGASVFVSSCRVMGSSSLPEPGFKVWENLY